MKTKKQVADSCRARKNTIEGYLVIFQNRKCQMSIIPLNDLINDLICMLRSMLRCMLWRSGLLTLILEIQYRLGLIFQKFRFCGSYNFFSIWDTAFKFFVAIEFDVNLPYRNFQPCSCDDLWNNKFTVPNGTIHRR